MSDTPIFDELVKELGTSLDVGAKPPTIDHPKLNKELEQEEANDEPEDAVGADE